jgi:hypothetical protein
MILTDFTRLRCSNQIALWLNTKRGYSYALMEPEDMSAVGWIAVIKSWENVGETGLHICLPVYPDMSPPDWWHHKGQPAGKQAWQRLVSQHQSYQSQLALEESDNNSNNSNNNNNNNNNTDDDTVPASKSRSCKGKAKAEYQGRPMHRRSAMTAQSPVKGAGLSQRGTLKSIAPRRSVRKRPAMYVEIDSSDPGDSSDGQQVTSLQAIAKDERACPPPLAKRSRVLTVDELAAQPSAPEASEMSHRQGTKERLPQEAPHCHPGPDAQRASASTLPQADSAITPVVRQTASGSPSDQGKYVVPFPAHALMD